MIPHVLLSGKDPENAGEAAGILKPILYRFDNVRKGDLAGRQEGAKATSIPNFGEVWGLGFEFVGWYQANGVAWNFDIYAVVEDLVLYPAWKDKNGNLYKVRVSEKLGICYSIKVGDAEEPSPSPSEEPSPLPSEEPSPAPSEEPSPSPSAEPSPAPSEEPCPSPSEEPSPSPSAEPSPAPSEKPRPSPSEGPSPAPSEEPSPAPSDVPAGES